jgi:hypothetical protein
MKRYQLQRALGLVKVPIDRWMIDEARLRIDRWPSTHDPGKAFMPNGEARQVGALGEVVALQYLSPLPFRVRDEGTVNHDLRVNGLRVDVKTKQRSVRPRMSYECSVAAYLQDTQHPDRYLFVTVQAQDNIGSDDEPLSRFVMGWVHGTISTEQFWSQATFWEEGQMDPSNGTIFPKSCWSVLGSDLDRPFELIETTNHEGEST